MTQVEETPVGWSLIDNIRASLQDLQPHTKADEQFYAVGQDQIQRLADARRMRLVAAEEGVPGVLWAVLIFGGWRPWASPASSGWRTPGRTVLWW